MKVPFKLASGGIYCAADIFAQGAKRRCAKNALVIPCPTDKSISNIVLCRRRAAEWSIFMIKLLIRRFIADHTNLENPKVRAAYGVFAGAAGIACNALLFAVKLIIGSMMNSIAIISDAFNNLSDMGSSLVAVIGSKMSSRRPDKEHPFGHGRIEYVSALVVAFFIMFAGFELIKTSFEKLLHPDMPDFNPILIGILSLSVLIKVWMFFYNRYIGRLINSGIMAAAARDSLSDVIVTGAVILSAVAGYYLNVPVDGVMGLAVSAFVMYTGFNIAKNTIDVLLGNPPAQKLVSEIEAQVCGGEGIVGVHDLIIHDYGPGRVMASVHAEVPDNADVVKIHEAIDAIEQKIFREMDVHIVIHMDPISVNCERTDSIRRLVKQTVKTVDDRFDIHDFRLTDGENRINLIFDLVVPCEMGQAEREKSVCLICDKLKEADGRFCAVIQIDNAY